MLRHRYVSAISTLALAACASPESNPATVAPADLRLEVVFGVDEAGDGAALLASPVFGVGDGHGGFVALEPFNGRLLRFDSSGALEWVHHAPGKGPGEIDNPDPPHLSPDGLIAFSNQSGSRIDFYAMTGHMEHSMGGLTSAGVLSGFLPDGQLVLSPHEPPDGVGTTVEILSGDTLSSRFTVSLDDTIEGSDLMPVRAAVRAFGSEVAVIHPGRYAYSFYSPDGEHLRRTTRDVDFSPPLIRQIPGGIQSQRFAILYGPYPLSEGRWLGAGAWPRGGPDLAEYVRLRDAGAQPPPLEMEHTFDIFGRGGELQYQVPRSVLDSLGVTRVLDVDAEGRVFAALRDGTVGRFGLVLDG